ncbi:MAG: hypothetical protein B7C24_15555 [Bacteroidetes bacterium 4572_77]|nr:MAG: hypothetical protein B7C24_15555 [Bacteroidetes bacterium 4572_77]
MLVFPWKNKAQFYAMKFILSKADFITSDSNYMSSVIKKIKHKQVLTFTFGLDRLPEYKENRKDENLYFSNRMLSENYNIDQVLENFALIYQENPNAQLLISHKGEEEANLKALCGKLEIHKAVKFLGFLKEQEQIDLYQKAACYFSLPTSDSTSVSLLEAMAYGCIPLLSDIPANREWVIDGENGLLIKEQISLSKLARLMENRAEVIKQNRGIISNRALFPDLIKTFVNEITK